jgi:hypothetical protein
VHEVYDVDRQIAIKAGLGVAFEFVARGQAIIPTSVFTNNQTQRILSGNNVKSANNNLPRKAPKLTTMVKFRQ